MLDYWLVVSTPLKKILVNGKDYPIYYGKIKNVPNHQADYIAYIYIVYNYIYIV